jgi:hypothetical protein
MGNWRPRLQMLSDQPDWSLATLRVAVATPASLASMPVTRQPTLLARYRAGPPEPLALRERDAQVEDQATK